MTNKVTRRCRQAHRRRNTNPLRANAIYRTSRRSTNHRYREDNRNVGPTTRHQLKTAVRIGAGLAFSLHQDSTFCFHNADFTLNCDRFHLTINLLTSILNLITYLRTGGVNLNLGNLFTYLNSSHSFFLSLCIYKFHRLYTSAMDCKAMACIAMARKCIGVTFPTVYIISYGASNIVHVVRHVTSFSRVLAAHPSFSSRSHR